MMAPESTHDAVIELLPWHASRALSDEEHQMVEQHLTDCAECRSELALLQEVGAATREFAEDIPPVPDMLPKTLAAIDEWEQSRSSGPLESLTRLLQTLWNPPVPVARAAFAVQFALIVAFAGLWLLSLPPGGYSTLSGPEATTNGVRLSVVFAPDTSEQTLRQTLLALDGRIVSGPSALGVYVVSLPLSEDDIEAIDAAVRQLRANDSVIDFVERQP